jgi:1-acylglycerone phosphate reductase
MTKKPTVLITGCTDGSIGHHLSLEFFRLRYQVFSASHRLSSMSLLVNDPSITILELDVTSSSSIQMAYEIVSRTTGGTLDILYQNAGTRNARMAMHCDFAVTERVFQANFVGVVEIMRVFLPLLRKAGGGSRIVFSNSLAAYIPLPSQMWRQGRLDRDDGGSPDDIR